jgi:hypothetical protein
VVTNGLAFGGCNSPPPDINTRYYIAPDASDEDPNTGPSSSSGGPSSEAGPTGNDGGEGGSPPTGDGGLSLALAGWWRASYAAAPWVGTASAGASGAQNLAAGTTAPTAGAALNGLGTASFNGINAWFSGAPVSTFHSTTTFSGWALVNINTINTNDATWSNNDTIVCTEGTGLFGIYLRDNGAGNVTVGVSAFSAVDRTVSTVIAKGVWQLVQWRSDGSMLSIRVNTGTWASTGTGPTPVLGSALDVGRNPAQNQFYDGRIADIGMTPVALTDADFETIRGYVDSRYGLSL